MHFSIAVIHHPDQYIDDLLEPYDYTNKDTYEHILIHTRDEAIEYARKYFLEPGISKSDEELWDMMAEGYDTDDEGNLYDYDNPNGRFDYYSVQDTYKALKCEYGWESNALLEDVLVFNVYAVVTPDGEWHDQDEGFDNIGNWPNDCVVTVVDCHV